jgi:hypothetical protein
MMIVQSFGENLLRADHRKPLSRSWLLHREYRMWLLPLLLLLWGGGTGLTVYSNAEARHSTQRVLHYMESLKDVEADREGTHSSFAASNLWFSLLTLWFLGLIAFGTNRELPDT